MRRASYPGGAKEIRLESSGMWNGGFDGRRFICFSLAAGRVLGEGNALNTERQKRVSEPTRCGSSKAAERFGRLQ